MNTFVEIETMKQASDDNENIFTKMVSDKLLAMENYGVTNSILTHETMENLK